MQRSGSCRVPKSENQQEIHQYCNRVESATRQGCCPSCPKGWGHSQGDRCLFGEGLRWKGGTWRGKMTLILIPAVIRGTLSSLQGTSNSFLLHLLLENLPCVYKSLSKDPRRRRVGGGVNIKLTKPVRSYQEDRSRLFTVVYGRRTRGNGHVEIREAQTGPNETFFIMQTVSYRNILPSEVV